MTDEISDDELEKRMSQKLFSSGRPASITVETRRRNPNFRPKVKTFIEVTGVKKSHRFEDDTFDMTIVSASARTKVKSSLYDEELKAQIDRYREDGTEVKFVDTPWHKWVR